MSHPTSTRSSSPAASPASSPRPTGASARRAGSRSQRSTWISARLHTAGADAGQSTAEYAVATVAACGFGGVLYTVLTSGPVAGLVGGLIDRALKTIGG